MKFVETLDGSFINWDDVSSVYHENHEIRGKEYLSSKIKLKNGNEHEFIECPSSFVDKFEKEHRFTADHLITWHKHTINTIIYRFDDNQVIRSDELLDKSWIYFLAEFEDFQQKNLT
jgi:hypothetical protein